MIKIKANDFIRDTIFFGLTILLLLTANLMTVFGGSGWQTGVHIMLVAIIMLNVSIICSLISNIRRDFPLLVFVVAFDTLLLGRVYNSWINYNHKILLLLEADSFENLFDALQIVAVSLFCVYLVYRLVGPLFNKRETAIRELGVGATSQNRLIPIIRQLSVIVLLISSLAFFYTLFKMVFNVLRSGYLNSFTNTVEIPSYISRLSMFFVPAFAIFLATLPNKKQMKWPLAIYSVYMLASVFTGRRNTIVTEAFMLIIYFVMRDTLLEKSKRVLKKRTVIFAGIFGIAAMYLLQLLALIRAGLSLEGRGFGEMLVSFFDSQGASFRVVMETVNHIALFPSETAYQYLFYPFELFVHNNVVTSTLFGLKPIIEVQNSAFVQTTHNFAHVLTYLVDPDRYLTGGGFGTSFIAEAYVAYRILGVVLVSAMIGLIFRFFSSMLTRSWVVIACALIAVKSFVYIPRSFAFLWVTEVFNITYLCFFVVIYLAALIIAKLGTHVRAIDPAVKPSFAVGDQP
jgi:oligosaccharide repeat unit polymerase